MRKRTLLFVVCATFVLLLAACGNSSRENKIEFKISADTNYVFHMLSVAKCGYDNEYGEKYRSRYQEEDLAVLKSHERLLTIKGGEHIGELYGLMVSEPAKGSMSVPKYYSALMSRIEKNEIPSWQKSEVLAYSDAIYQISEVMIKYYDDYAENIFPIEKKQLEAYYPEVQRVFEEISFTATAEALVGCKFPGECFYATLVSGVSGGAEAIDISEDQDVFGIDRESQDEVYFIGHEFIIYLLRDALREENSFKEFATWELTEGLAEYYLKKIMGDTRFFCEQQKWVAFYEAAEEAGAKDAVSLYRAALESEEFKLTNK